MSITATRRPSTGVRRAGYVVAVVANLVMAWLVAVWPGWDVVPVLTAETTTVLPYVYASIATGVVVNLAYVADDRPWLKATGDLVNAVVGLVAVVRTWQVYPFDFDGHWAGWELLVRVALVVAAVGTAIAILVQLVALARTALGPRA